MDKQVRSLLVNNVEFDFGNCIPRLQLRKIHNWLSNTCGVKAEDQIGSMPIFQAPTQVLRMKFVSEVLFKQFLEKYAGKHRVVFGGRTVEVRVYNAGEVSTFVSIGDVPFEVELEEIEIALGKFGRVERIERRAYQGAGFLAGKQGWITASMILGTPIPSYVEIGYCRAMVKYDGQDATCKGCNETGHWLRNCPNSVWARRMRERVERERNRREGEEEERERIERAEKEKEENRKREEEREINEEQEKIRLELERFELEERKKRDEERERERVEKEKERIRNEKKLLEEAERKRKEQGEGGMITDGSEMKKLRNEEMSEDDMFDEEVYGGGESGEEGRGSEQAILNTGTTMQTIIPSGNGGSWAEATAEKEESNFFPPSGAAANVKVSGTTPMGLNMGKIKSAVNGFIPMSSALSTKPVTGQKAVGARK